MLSDEMRHYYLDQMDIEPWVLRHVEVDSQSLLMIVCDQLIVIGAADGFNQKVDYLLNQMLGTIGVVQDIRGTFNAQVVMDKKPPFIIALGHLAGQFLLKRSSSFAKMRYQLHDYQGIPFLVSDHPADLLRYPKNKANAYKDLLLYKQWVMGFGCVN